MRGSILSRSVWQLDTTQATIKQTQSPFFLLVCTFGDVGGSVLNHAQSRLRPNMEHADHAVSNLWHLRRVRQASARHARPLTIHEDPPNASPLNMTRKALDDL
jgi:hypothetical protein